MSAQGLPTRFTRLVGVRHPVMQEGLGPYKTVRLAAAVATAGGLGTVSIPGISEEASVGARILRGYIEEACSLTDGVLAVNVPVGADKVTGKALPFSAAYVRAVVEAVRDPVIAKRLRVITTSAGPPAAARELIAGRRAGDGGRRHCDGNPFCGVARQHGLVPGVRAANSGGAGSR